MTLAPKPITASGLADLGEGPVWDHRLGRLYWVDITRGRIHWLEEGGERKTQEAGGTVGFAVLTRDPDILLIGRSTALTFLNTVTGKLAAVPMPEPPVATNRFNDGKCDPTGRLYAGTMPLQGCGPNNLTGHLYSMDSRMAVTCHLSNVGCSNGLAWWPARGQFYYNDSVTRRTDVFQWNRDTGEIINRRTFREFTSEEGVPDGMTIDADGNLWVCFWGGACVRHIDGVSGKTLEKIDFPVNQVTSCAFGGKGRDVLYVTTAATELSNEQRAQQPLAGAIFTLRPGARGLPSDLFSGVYRGSWI